jgi:hypothetical protein
LLNTPDKTAKSNHIKQVYLSSYIIAGLSCIFWLLLLKRVCHMFRLDLRTEPHCPRQICELFKTSFWADKPS